MKVDFKNEVPTYLTQSYVHQSFNKPDNVWESPGVSNSDIIKNC